MKLGKKADKIAKQIAKLSEEIEMHSDEMDALVLTRNVLIKELYTFDDVKNDDGTIPAEVEYEYNGRTFGIQRRVTPHYDSETFMAVYSDMADELRKLEIKKIETDWEPSQSEIKALLLSKDMRKQLEELEDGEKIVYAILMKANRGD